MKQQRIGRRRLEAALSSWAFWGAALVCAFLLFEMVPGLVLPVSASRGLPLMGLIAAAGIVVVGGGFVWFRRRRGREGLALTLIAYVALAILSLWPVGLGLNALVDGTPGHAASVDVVECRCSGGDYEKYDDSTIDVTSWRGRAGEVLPVDNDFCIGVESATRLRRPGEPPVAFEITVAPGAFGIAWLRTLTVPTSKVTPWPTGRMWILAGLLAVWLVLLSWPWLRAMITRK